MAEDLKEAVANMEIRLSAMESIVEELRETNALLHDIRAALRVFSAIGSGVKWVIGLGASITMVLYGIKHWMNS